MAGHDHRRHCAVRRRRHPAALFRRAVHLHDARTPPPRKTHRREHGAPFARMKQMNMGLLTQAHVYSKAAIVILFVLFLVLVTDGTAPIVAYRDVNINLGPLQIAIAPVAA